MWWLLAGCPTTTPMCTDACFDSAYEPPYTPPPASTGDTADSATDTGTPSGTPLPATLGAFTPCPGSTTANAALEVVDVAAGTFTVARSGPIHGCGAPTELRATLDGDTIHLRWVAGDCDAVFCYIGAATVTEVPAGDYTVVDAAAGASLEATVTVP